MLARTLEPEVMDTAQEASDYDAMDHSEVNARFVADLACLELSVTEVFDAPESAPWPADAIARIPQEAWEGAVFRPPRCLAV